MKKLEMVLCAVGWFALLSEAVLIPGIQWVSTIVAAVLLARAVFILLDL